MVGSGVTNAQTPLPKTGFRDFEELVNSVRNCQQCRATLPFDPKPVFQIDPRARVLVVGQAPGIRAHQTGTPFNDPSGDRLRIWMGVDRQTFYDCRKIALLPMAFCYPGTGKGGDLPPPEICAQKWRVALLSTLRQLKTTILCGKYAIRWHLGSSSSSLSEIIKRWKEYPENLTPIPHPSGRNNGWLRRNPWFEAQLVPELKARVACALSE